MTGSDRRDDPEWPIEAADTERAPDVSEAPIPPPAEPGAGNRLVMLIDLRKVIGEE